MHAWIATLFLLLLSVVSSVFYLDNIHSVKRFENSKPIKSLPSFKFIYIFILATTLILSPICFFYDFAFLLKWHSSLFWLYTGLALSSLSMALFIAAKINLGANYNPCFAAFVPKDIIRDGLYKYIRHPIYTANILVLLGVFMATGSWLLFPNVILLSTFYYLASQNEEMTLTQEFPEYIHYIKSTGAFLPKLTPVKNDLKYAKDTFPSVHIDKSREVDASTSID